MKQLGILIILAGSTASAWAQAPGANASSIPIVTQEVVISGTTTLGSSELQEITDNLSARRWRNDAGEVKERIRNEFQERGYFGADVSEVEIKRLDQLARPMPVRIEANVTEGPRFKITGFRVENNKGMTAEQITALLPLKVGDLFSTGAVRSGLAAMRKAYAKNGYLDFYAVPTTEKLSDAQVQVIFDMHEGDQFRMGALHVDGAHDIAEKLERLWKLGPGEPFDYECLQQFLDDNKDLLPADFSRGNTYLVKNCHDGTVSVHIALDMKAALQPREKNVGCDKPKDSDKDGQ